MQFTTQIPILKSSCPIDYNAKLVSLGSCFAENMGSKFDYFKFQNTTNPFGIIFNPVSLNKIIRRIVEKDFFTEQDVFFFNERWHCFEVHSNLSHPDKTEFLSNLNNIVATFHHKIKEATHLILTYGSSWVYKTIADNNIVANCHKVPQQEFSKELLSVEMITESIQRTISLIQNVNPKCNVIFTISPVRHLKDGFIENQRSKSHLFAALHQVLDLKPDHTHYFPAYEIMMDELRDYRFYGNDMLHPSSLAVDYIWSRFVQSYISPESLPVMGTIDTIQKGLAHRAFQPELEQHQKFLEQLQEKIKWVESQFQHIQF